MTEDESLYDCLIVGGGPAGLSAAIYMGRFLRKTIVLDEGKGRSSFAQVNENYLGFPDGLKVQELRELGKRQAERFGVEFVDCRVDSFDKAEWGVPIVAHTNEGDFRAKTAILCTGVRDVWPPLPDVEEFVGKTLFWCITCDGFRAWGKRLVLFGSTDYAAVTACQFRAYTDQIHFVFPPGQVDCSDERMKDMEAAGVEIIEGIPSGVDGTPDELQAVVLQDGRRLPADLMFSLIAVLPNNKLALDLGLEVDDEGYVKVDEEGYTSVGGIFCAGDLSKMHTHQVIAAAAEGAEAAQTANYWLYACYQRNERRHPSKRELVERVRSSSG